MPIWENLWQTLLRTEPVQGKQNSEIEVGIEVFLTTSSFRVTFFLPPKKHPLRPHLTPVSIGAYN